MFIYIVTALAVLAVVCLAAIVAQNARKFDYAEYVIGGDRATNIKQLALALKDVEKVGAVPNVRALLTKIARAYKVVCAKVKRGETLYECEKWLYENYRSFTLGIKKNGYKDFATLPHKGEARVIHLASTLTAQVYCRIDAENVSEAVREFCRYTPLTYDEICALRSAFEVALLKKIAFVADRIRMLEKVKRRAEEDKEPDYRYGKKEGYLYFYKLQGKKISEKFLSKNTQINIENVDFAFAGAMSDYARLISNAIMSLKELGNVFSLAFCIKLSPINAYFERDDHYLGSDAASKAQYLSAVSRLSRYFNAGEYAVAKGAFDLAARFDKHFGEILFDHRYDLRAHLKGKYVEKLKNTSYSLDKWLYYGSVFLLQTVFAAISSVFLPGLSLKLGVAALVFVAVYPPACYIAERALAFMIPKRPVSRLDHKCIPEEGKTAVVVSHYLTSPEQAEKAAQDLLALQAVNRDKNAFYFLLADFKESEKEIDDTDFNIISALEKYSGRENFVALVRKRVRNGKLYGAYERKRGAIRDFNEFMLTGDRSKFRFVSDDFDFKPRFVITLDADSRLGAGEVRTAVNTMLHPLNAKFDMMTFSSVYSLSSLTTRYSKKFRQSSGAQIYCGYDDFYFNLCNRAVFCGKGIYSLEEFHSKTSAAVPDGRVLSHDILEGALTETGSLNLATAEDAPDNFVSDVSRRKRWARGDLLLLPFAGRKFCSDGIYTYIILKNAFSYLAPIAACVLWILALYFMNPFLLLGLFFASFAAPVASLVVTFATSSGVKTKALLRKAADVISEAVSDVLLLPFYAVENISVIFGTFADYVFNSRALLKWKPFAQLQGRKGYSSHAAVVWFSCVLTVIIAALLRASLAVSVYAIMFVVYVNALYFEGKKYKSKRIKEQYTDALYGYAVKTFSYFEELGEGLPCDNIQIYPPKGKSATTSPTNIGYAMLSHVCAVELGIEDAKEAQRYIDLLTEKCEKLEKWRGHLYNWYNVDTEKPVNPFFVSSVDSGNFIAALITCRSFCIKHGFLVTAERCKKLIDETDFSALVNKEKNRLYIGYNVGAKRYEGEYDLLASEARLTAYVASCLSCDDTLWRSLSRIQVNCHGNVLASWSGTAFEYLMPQIFLPDVKGSLITTAVRRAVKTFYKADCNGLWGISESGYYAFDNDANYQYKAHGLERLALRSADDRCIISPYASAMAVEYEPEKVVENLKKLESCGCYGDYGFYEAIDFTSGKNTVCSSMTHHQGMIICALTNALKEDIIKNYFFDDDRMRGGALMLEEKEDESKAKRRKSGDFVYDRKENAFCRDVELGEFPKVCLLYGREYSVVIDDYGSGYSRWRDKDINAFSSNFYKNSGAYGYFICDGEIFSPTFAPLKKDGGVYKVHFSDSCAEYFNTRSDCSVKIYSPTVISGEVREYTVKNSSDRVKNYEFVFAERTALAERREYAAHPAFCDLFVNARFDKDNGTLYLDRKPREATGGFTLAATMLGGGEISAECNRANLFGRNRDESNPALCFGGDAPSLGDVITPCIGLKCAFSLSPGQSKTVAVVVQCAEDRNTLENRVRQVLSTDFLSYASHRSEGADKSAISKYLSDCEIADYAGKLAAKLLYEPYPKSALLARLESGKDFSDGVKNLVLKYDGNATFTKKAVKSAIACKLSGIDLRLTVLYDETDGYNGETAAEVCERSTVSDLISLPFVTFTDISGIKPVEVKNLLSCAFWVMKDCFDESRYLSPIAVRRRSGNTAFSDCTLPELFCSGNGGFDQNGDYIVTSRPLAPYSNVVAAKNGGFVTTENGGGFAYFLNSQADKLTGWSNDSVADAPYERMLVSDGTAVIRVNKLNQGGYVRHSKGSSDYFSKTSRAGYTFTKALAFDGRVNASILKIENLSDGKLSLEATYLAEPCADSCENRTDVLCEKYGSDAARVLNVRTKREFFLLVKSGAELITDCRQALSRGSNGYNPKRTESPFNNPLIGATVKIEIKKKSSATLIFALCDSIETLEAARSADLEKECMICSESVEGNKVTELVSGDKALDHLFENLPYQVMNSRMNGRCGFYQAGGAIGFRDQLQDCLALLWTDPERVREHILYCAERQYIEGDVMHWWHSPAFGVRTRITDDRLFLPYVTCEYIAHTGDVSILEEKCDYLIGAPLDDLQEARLEHGQYAGVRESLLLHIQRAIDSAMVTGEHGLLLIGSGDWNDALNGIGMRGRGESVWLTQFAVAVIDRFCEYIDDESAKRYKRAAQKLRKALENAYFDGKWARAFTDGGEWLGTKRSKACKTDLLCQSWAVIAGIGTSEQRESAMKAAKTLVDEKCGAVRLFNPPFDGSKRYGYISSYPQGVRENGGQYTHAAVWYLLACCKAGDKKEANRVLKILNPVARCTDFEKNKAYKAEPYVLAGDVYTNKDNEGRAGWTWYTGSAAWLYKVITEEMLGIKKRGETLVLSAPVIENADKIIFRYRYKGTIYQINYEYSEIKGIRIGGVNYTNSHTVPLKENAGTVRVTVLC